jgi:hypothetical protein
MTPTQRQAMERALMLLESAHVATDLVWERNDCCEALRAALAEQSGSEDKASADRYQKLKTMDWYVGPSGFYCDEAGGLHDYENFNGGELDAAIDAARIKP